MTRIVSKEQAGQPRPESTHRATSTSALPVVALSLVLLATAGAARGDDNCGLGEVRLGFRQLASGSETSREWVQSKLIDGDADQPRTVGVDGTIAAIAFSHHVESTAMEAPRDFTFRSGWLLNTQFAFRKGDQFRSRARYDTPSGSTFYALAPPGEPYLTIFARPDGTLCNKVMNTNAGDHGFLVKKYESSPATKLTTQTGGTQSEPLVLKIVYLGSTGGLASFREIWSRRGRIVDVVNHTFDPSARQLQIGPVTLQDVTIIPATVTVRIAPPTRKISFNHYWAERFSR